jgi:hypothetical protein
MPHPMCGLVFELEFRVTIREVEGKQVCLGYAVQLPEINSVGVVVEKDIQVKLLKGPGETLSNTMLFSEQVSEDNIFDFGLRAFISTSQQPPN